MHWQLCLIVFKTRNLMTAIPSPALACWAVMCSQPALLLVQEALRHLIMKGPG